MTSTPSLELMCWLSSRACAPVPSCPIFCAALKDPQQAHSNAPALLAITPPPPPTTPPSLLCPGPEDRSALAQKHPYWGDCTQTSRELTLFTILQAAAPPRGPVCIIPVGSPTHLFSAKSRILCMPCRQGRLYSGLYSNSIKDAATLYPSTSYLDDMALACMWLWQRTGVTALLSEAQNYLQQHEAQETTVGAAPRRAWWHWKCSPLEHSKLAALLLKQHIRH